MDRYGKRADLIVHEREPFNAETGLAALDEGPLTATDAFYVRGHGAVPEIDPAAWRLRVEGAVERALDLSFATLREAFVERSETATLQCAGNRRAGLMAIRDIPGEAPWAPARPGPPRGRAWRSPTCSRWPDRSRRPRTSASKAPTCARRPSPPSASAARSGSTRRAAPRSCSPGR